MGDLKRKRKVEAGANVETFVRVTQVLSAGSSSVR